MYPALLGKEAYIEKNMIKTGVDRVWPGTPQGRAANIKLRVDTGSSRFNCSRSFLSVGLPHLHYKWDAINFSSPRIQQLAAALSPASVRIYGTPILTGKDARRFEKEKRNLTGEDGAQSRYHHPDQILITGELDHFISSKSRWLAISFRPSRQD
ncbi:hypothetical protein Btru_037641 [Bulinus truncatus]|nr:hypothetical protein Btru_037641 [Bulinus truncatus]